MRQSRGSDNADVRFHAEVPSVTFLDLMHLRITPAFPVLGRGRHSHQGGIDDRAFLENHSLFGHVGTKDRVSTEMSLHVLAYNLKRVMKILGIGIRQKLANAS